VVIPSFNRAAVLERAVRSVLSHTGDEFELIVVDDGSTDDSVRRLRGFDDIRLRIIQQPNLGVCAARNRGIAASRGRLVTWLDSDDLAQPGWIDFWLGAEIAGADIATCSISFVRPDGRAMILEPVRHGLAFGNLQAQFLAGALGVDRSLLLEVGAFRQGLEHSEHTDLALRLGRVALERPLHVVVTDQTLATTFRRPGAVDPEVMLRSAVALLDHDLEHLRRSPELHATYLGLAGWSASKLGRRRHARYYLARAIRVRPTSLKNWARLAVALIRPGRRATQP
jgi:hypothetical protein